MGQNGTLVRVMDNDAAANVSSMYRVCSAETSGRHIPAQPPVTTDNFLMFAPQQESTYVSSTSAPTSTSTSSAPLRPRAFHDQTFTNPPPQIAQEAYVDLLDEEPSSEVVVQPDALESMTADYLQYYKQGLLAGTLSMSSRSSTDTWATSPGSPPSSTTMFGTVQPGLHRCP